MLNCSALTDVQYSALLFLNRRIRLSATTDQKIGSGSATLVNFQLHFSCVLDIVKREMPTSLITRTKGLAHRQRSHQVTQPAFLQPFGEHKILTNKTQHMNIEQCCGADPFLTGLSIFFTGSGSSSYKTEGFQPLKFVLNSTLSS